MKEKNNTFENELNTNGLLVYTNVGVSMLPLIKENRDVLVAKKAEIKDLKKYDIVLFRRNNAKGRGEYVLHRIIKFLPDSRYYIAGDNCTSGETVEAEQIMGVLVSVQREEKAIRLNGFIYGLYVYMWCAPYHLRFLILGIKSLIKFICKGIGHKLKVLVKK